MFVRPCRSATIRTRLDLDAVRARLSGLAAQGTPPGSEVWVSRGFIRPGGSVDAHDFRLDFRLNSARNQQTYAVRGHLQDTNDWRVLRLTLTAHDPWLSRVELFFLVVFTGLYAVTGEMPPGGAIAALLGLMALYAFVNLLWVPDMVTGRVTGILATELNGSIQRRDEWVVPQ